MKKILLIILLIFALAITFAACGVTHEHTFATDKWSSDETNHWHAATCEHTDATDGKAPHEMETISTDKTLMECKVCGYQTTTQHKHTVAAEYSVNEQGHWHATTCGCSYEDFAPHNMQVLSADKTLMECTTCGYQTATQHEHTFEANYSADESGHCLNTTCGCAYVNFAPHRFVDGVCDTCGWWSSTTDVLMGELSKLNVWDYTLLLDNVTITGVNMLSEGEVVEQNSLIVSGEFRLNLTADGQLEGEGYFQADGIAIKAVVSNDTVYACGNGKYYRCTLDELLARADIDLEQIQKNIDKLNADTQNARKYVELMQQYLTKLPTENLKVKQLLDKLVKPDEANSSNELTAYVLDTDVLRQLNEMLAVTTVQEYVDEVFGEGFFVNLPEFVESLLNTQVGKIVWDLQTKYGITVDDILTVVNFAIEQFYPNDDINTIEELLISKGADLKNLTVKQWIDVSSLFKLRTALEMLQRNSDNPVTATEIIDKVEDFCKAYGDKTLYEIAVANNQEQTAEDVKLLVGQAIDLLDGYLTVEFYLDENGVLQQVELIVSESDSEEEHTDNQLQQLLEGISGTILLQRGYVTEQDYSKVIEQVNAYYDSLEQSAA